MLTLAVMITIRNIGLKLSPLPADSSGFENNELPVDVVLLKCAQ